MKQSPIFAPSILAANFARLGEESQNVIEAGADWIHLDVMDNHFVPNLTIGPMVCHALRKDGITVPIDVHLMVKPVDAMIDAFAQAGATSLSIHPESTDNLAASLKRIHENGCQSAIAVNPNTPIDCVQPYLDTLDMILIMSVEPGFGGQLFMPDVLPKLEIARRWIDASGRHIRLQIDGGITLDNLKQVSEAGADTFVTGTAIFKTEHYQQTLTAMRQCVC